jgi:hypothetical protein
MHSEVIAVACEANTRVSHTICIHLIEPQAQLLPVQVFELPNAVWGLQGVARTLASLRRKARLLIG